MFPLTSECDRCVHIRPDEPRGELNQRTNFHHVFFCSFGPCRTDQIQIHSDRSEFCRIFGAGRIFTSEMKYSSELNMYILSVCVNWLRYRPQHSFLMFHRDVMFATSDELLCFLSAGLIRLVFLSLNIPFCFSPLPSTFSLLHSALLHIHTIACLLVFLQCSSLTCKHVAVRLCLNRNLTRTQTHMRCCITEVFPQ